MFRPAALLVIAVSLFTLPLADQSASALRASADTRTPAGEWSTYGGNLASTRYSQLDQINAGNFNKLEVAWRFKTDNLGAQPEFDFQSTPLMVNGRLYSTGGSRRAVVALDAATGELKWVYSLNEGERGAAAPRKQSGRGLAYWTDGKDERIVYVTPGYQMIALDAKTGRPVNGFGAGGIVDLKADAGQHMDLVKADIGLAAAPIIVKDVIVVGAAHAASRTRTNVKGLVRGYDVRTGKRLWMFTPIPGAGESGSETWEKDSASYTGNAGAWGQMSADEQLGLLYVPTEAPTNDVYGGHRPGANLFSDTLVALDIKTGVRVWYYQFVHHDIWDFDLPCAPILADIVVDGRPIKAVAQPTKQGWVFVFDRTNGTPVWPIEERPVPKGDVPGEWYSQTQPVPTKPPANERQELKVDELIDFTPELRKEATEIISKFKYGSIYTPPPVAKGEGPRGLLMFPSPLFGGANWQGGSLDPDTNTLYIYSTSSVFYWGVIHDPRRSDAEFSQATTPPDPPGGPDNAGNGTSVRGLPIIKPPYGRITAIDLNKGEMLWQIAHGETPDNVKNHPLLKGLTIPRTGRQGRIGTLVTKTLLIAGEGGMATTASGKPGAMLRAYDKATGKDAGEVYMPAPQTGSPMTYLLNGQQYIVVAISANGYSGELVAFRLPKAR